LNPLACSVLLSLFIGSSLLNAARTSSKLENDVDSVRD
jgi:hypothetical protein